MRDLMMLAMMMVIVPISLTNAFAAYLVWGWTAVIAVPYYLYGFMGSLRYNLFFALITISMVLLGRIKERGQFKLSASTLLILLFVAHGGVSALLAAPSALDNWSIYTNLLKSVAYCLLMPLFVNSRLRLHAMLVAIALGLGFHGGVEGLKTLVTAGGHKVLGIPGTKMGDNNHFGVAIVMVLPVLLYLFQYSKLRIMRWGFLGLVGLTVIAVIGSSSRGAFVAMALVAGTLVMTSRRKTLALVVVLVAGAVLLAVGPDDRFARIATITQAGEDSSFMGRVQAWNVATAVALKNPIFGSGFHAAQSAAVWFSVDPRDGLLSGFLPDRRLEWALAAHSIFFEVLGDLGFVGLFFYIALIVNAFVTVRRIKRLAKRQGASMMWAYDMAQALGLSCLAFVVGGAAVSLAYLETFYVVICLIEALNQTVLQQTRSTRLSSRAGRGPVVAT
jgi:probable O-glycosylation ligase (exosortase A-associated)